VAVLAKKNMLRVLGVSFFVLLVVLPLGFCQESDCSECSKGIADLNPGLKEKIEEIQRQAYDRMSGVGQDQNSEIILFIDPDSDFSDTVVSALVNFKKENPGWIVKTVIVTNDKQGLKNRLIRKRDYFNNGMEFDIDFNGNLTRQFGIDKTPSYVIFRDGKHCIITGRTDLSEIIEQLNK